MSSINERESRSLGRRIITLWTFIRKEKFDDYISEYPKLQESPQELILHDSEDAYFLPRLFHRNFPSTKLELFTGKQETYEPAKIDHINFKGSLRDEQIPIVEKVLALYEKQGFINGIVKARPGLGDRCPF